MGVSLQQIKPKVITIIAIFVAIAFGLLLLIWIQSGKQKNGHINNQPTQKYTEVIPPLEGRPSPTKNAQDIKKVIIASKISEQNGTLIVYKTSSYIVTYVPTPDIFFVNILKIPFDTNKNQAEKWFLNFGLKQEELCTLPVRFSVGFQAPMKEKLSYNPFPNGCTSK